MDLVPCRYKHEIWCNGSLYTLLQICMKHFCTCADKYEHLVLGLSGKETEISHDKTILLSTTKFVTIVLL